MFQAASLPLSIIIIGVGNANCDNMNELDGDGARVSFRGQPAAKDIVIKIIKMPKISLQNRKKIIKRNKTGMKYLPNFKVPINFNSLSYYQKVRNVWNCWRLEKTRKADKNHQKNCKNRPTNCQKDAFLNSTETQKELPFQISAYYLRHFLHCSWSITFCSNRALIGKFVEFRRRIFHWLIIDLLWEIYIA